MINSLRNFSIIIIGVFLLFACKPENINSVYDKSGSVDGLSTITDEYFVTEDLAISAAENFVNQYNFDYKKLLRKEEVTRKGIVRNEAAHVLTFMDRNDEPALYLINLQEQGFTIVPADTRLNPFLAHSKINSMPTSMEEALPGGLQIWLNANMAAVDSVRGIKSKGNAMHEGWKALLSSNKSKDKPDPNPPCEDEFEEITPLIESKWGQRDGYNNQMQNMSCSNSGFPSNGKAYTGCVATAMAQIMRHHEHPSNYDWSAMPDGPIYDYYQPSGTNEIAQLMRNIADNVNMSYECSGSSADEDEIAASFISDFGYSNSTQKTSYEGTSNYNLVVDELKNNRPVLFTGYQEGNKFFIPHREGGHAWVSDGYRKSFFCDTGTSHLILHMNWGWNGSNYDGWYSFNNFNPGDTTYNYKSAVIHGIQP